MLRHTEQPFGQPLFTFVDKTTYTYCFIVSVRIIEKDITLKRGMNLNTIASPAVKLLRWLLYGGHVGALTIFLVALLLGVATPYSYFMNPERGLYVICLVFVLFVALFSVLGSAEHEIDKFGIEEAVLGQTPLLGHMGGVSVVDVSSGPCQRIVSGSYDGTARTWNLQTGAQEHVYTGHTGPVFALAVSKSDYVVSGGIDRTIQVWDICSGAHIKTLTGHTGSILSLRLLEPRYSCCDETIVLSGGHDGTVNVWSLALGLVLHTLDVPAAGSTRPLAMSTVSVSSGPAPVVVAGSSIGLIYMWSLNSGSFVGHFEGHFGAVLCLAVSPSLKRPLVVSCSVDWTVRVWDIRGNRHVMTLEGHSGAVGSVTICGGNDDGDTAALQCLPSDSSYVRGKASLHLIVSGGRDSTIRVWDLYTGELYLTLEDHADSVNAVALSMSAFPPWAYQGCKSVRSSETDIPANFEGFMHIESSAVKSSDNLLRASDSESGVVSRLTSYLSGVENESSGPGPQLIRRYSSAKRSSALIVTGGVEASIKVWDLEKIIRDIKWKKRKSWAIFISLSRNRNLILSSDNTAPEGVNQNKIELRALLDKPGFSKVIYIDDLCGEIASYM